MSEEVAKNIIKWGHARYLSDEAWQSPPIGSSPQDVQNSVEDAESVGFAGYGKEIVEMEKCCFWFGSGNQ